MSTTNRDRYLYRADIPELRTEIKAAEAQEKAAWDALMEAKRQTEYLRETLRISLMPLPNEKVVVIHLSQP